MCLSLKYIYIRAVWCSIYGFQRIAKVRPHAFHYYNPRTPAVFQYTFIYRRSHWTKLCPYMHLKKKHVYIVALFYIYIHISRRSRRTTCLSSPHTVQRSLYHRHICEQLLWACYSKTKRCTNKPTKKKKSFQFARVRSFTTYGSAAATNTAVRTCAWFFYFQELQSAQQQCMKDYDDPGSHTHALYTQNILKNIIETLTL